MKEIDHYGLLYSSKKKQAPGERRLFVMPANQLNEVVCNEILHGRRGASIREHMKAMVDHDAAKPEAGA
jgi:hypothetical protein